MSPNLDQEIKKPIIRDVFTSARAPQDEEFDDFLGLLRPKTPVGKKVKLSTDPTDNELAAKIRRIQAEKEAEWVHLGDRLLLSRQFCTCCGSSTVYVKGVLSVDRDRKSGTIRKSFARGGNVIGLTLEPEVEQELIPACPSCLNVVADPELDELFGTLCSSPEEEQLSFRF